LRLSPTLLADGSPAWQSDGAPSDCVALAMMGALEQDFDLLVSGINPNANIGLDVTYSGTVTAAMKLPFGASQGLLFRWTRPRTTADKSITAPLPRRRLSSPGG